MAIKYYAVRNGKTVGIFKSWDECKKQIDGYSGAEYKSFKTIEEAKGYMAGDVKSNKPLQQLKPESIEKTPYEPGVAIAYTDGSYNPATHEFSCGAVLFYEHEKIEFSKKYNDPDMADMRNVAGEIMGSVSVIQYCLENEINALWIYHDYEGVGKWANGQWKTNKEGTRAYAEFCKKAKEKVRLKFVHVKGHSGDIYNDEADILAKKALGIV